jgi:hypothetical protein
MRSLQVSYEDKLGVERVLRGQYAEMYAWSCLVAGGVLVLAGVMVFIRETLRRRRAGS